MAAAKTSFLKKTGKYIKDVRSEMRKVSWPTKSDLSTYTLVVIVTVMIVSGIIWLADTVLYKVVSLILR